GETRAFDEPAGLGVAAHTSLLVMRSEDQFHDVLTKVRRDLPEYIVVVRDNEAQPRQPYYYAFRSEELLDFATKVDDASVAKARLRLWQALEADPSLRLGEDSASGSVPVTNMAAPRVNFGKRGPTAARTVVLDGSAPRAVIEPAGAANRSA